MSTVSAFFNPPFLNPVMELSNAPLAGVPELGAGPDEATGGGGAGGGGPPGGAGGGGTPGGGGGAAAGGGGGAEI